MNRIILGYGKAGEICNHIKPQFFKKKRRLVCLYSSLYCLWFSLSYDVNTKVVNKNRHGNFVFNGTENFCSYVSKSRFKNQIHI